MTEEHFITREISIDAGHRVTHHGSKCKNLHGHRYTVQATCVGPLFIEGEQEGMVLDFGFLKEEMMREIDVPCDHGMILWLDDPYTEMLTGPNTMGPLRKHVEINGYFNVPPEVNDNGEGSKIGKMYVVPFVPTAENLARHWFNRLTPRVNARTEGLARLHKIKVWETPNCSAEYSI